MGVAGNGCGNIPTATRLTLELNLRPIHSANNPPLQFLIPPCRIPIHWHKPWFHSPLPWIEPPSHSLPNPLTHYKSPWFTLHNFNPLIQVFLTLRNPVPIKAGSHYDLLLIYIFMTTLLLRPVLLFLNPLSLVIIHTCWRAPSVPLLKLWALKSALKAFCTATHNFATTPFSGFC